jgi:hypothetical protein
MPTPGGPGCLTPQPSPTEQRPGEQRPGEQRPGEQPSTDTTTPSTADTQAQAPQAGLGGEATGDGTLFGDLQPILPVLTMPRNFPQFFTSPIPSGTLGLNGTPISGVTFVGMNPAAAQAQANAMQQARQQFLSVANAAPLPFRTAFKISENENPAPQTRAFVTYNYYSDVLPSGQAFNTPSSQVHREIAGFEWAFWDGDASIGLRAPAFQVHSAGFEDSQLGDLTMLFKYAFYRDRESHDLMSAGIVVTAPTGPSLPIFGESNVHSTVLQPYVGGILHCGDFFLVDFTSLAVPTDSRDVTLFFDSIGLGYRLYHSEAKDAFLTSVVPQLEMHLNIPLNHQGLDSVPVGFPTSVDFTGGIYITCHKATIGFGAGTPLTGPRPYGVEGLASLNYKF